jgi:putative hydrolases of HD superfamily
MDNSRLSRQISFILELDRLKTILRQSLIGDGSRQENDAEHSWHVSVMALLLAEYAPPQADAWRAAQMLLFHDVVEIDAGDTFIHDDVGNASKAQREQAAADRLYALLPDDQRDHFRALWEEFEARDSATARFANSLDRLQPILNNVATQGRMWQKNRVTAPKLMGLVGRIAQGCPALGDYAHQLVEEAVRKGYLPAE